MTIEKQRTAAPEATTLKAGSRVTTHHYFRRILGSPWSIAAVVLLAYAGFLFASYHNGRDARYFIRIGTHFLLQSHASSVIKLDPHYQYLKHNDVGYDGQFDYYIALDPVNARYYMDETTYRYGRILYPITARLLALGQSDAIPYTLILINLLALTGGTLALAAWLRRKSVSPWFALVFGLFPGLFVSLQRDLNEPLAYALVALAIYLFDFGGKQRILWAGICFALAALTRETTFVFPILYGLAILFGRSSVGGGWRERVRANWSPRGYPAALLLGLALIPIILYREFLFLWLGQLGLSENNRPTPIPLQGLFWYSPWPNEQISEAFSIVLPGLICVGLSLWALAKRIWRVEVWILLANALLFVVFLNRHPYVEYAASGRITAVVALAALLCLPFFGRLTGNSRAWLWICTILWFLPWYSLLPAAIGGS
jgi:hypothetical protein